MRFPNDDSRARVWIRVRRSSRSTMDRRARRSEGRPELEPREGARRARRRGKDGTVGIAMIVRVVYYREEKNHTAWFDGTSASSMLELSTRMSRMT